MNRKFYGILLYKWLGWKVNVTVPMREKSILCVAPHTSNWDFIIGILYEKSIGLKSFFLMKSSWFFWPLGRILRNNGGIPIDRSRHSHLTEYLAGIMRHRRPAHIAITPEGTRSFNPHWKKGFYFIAQKAEIPIQLYAIDYEHKTIVCTEEIFPSGDVENDFLRINNYYAQFMCQGRKPHKFALNEDLTP